MMTKTERLLERILNSQKNMKFSDVVILLNALGFARKRVSGSHHIYKHPDVQELLSLQPDQNGQAKPYQIRHILKLIEEYGVRLESATGEQESESDEDNEA